jgi:hypothetical protein
MGNAISASGEGELVLELREDGALSCVGGLPGLSKEAALRLISSQARLRTLTVRDGASGATVWTEEAGEAFDAEETWRDSIFRVYHLSDGSCRVLRRTADGHAVVLDGSTMQELVRLDLSDQDGGSSALWPLDLFVVGGGGRDPLLAVLLGDRPLTRHELLLRIARLPPRRQRVAVYDERTGALIRTIQSQRHRADHQPSITKPTLARRGGGGGALLAWICDWEDLELYDVETGGIITGTSATFGDLRVSQLAWFNPSPDGPAPFLAVGQAGGMVVVVYDGGSGTQITGFKATDPDGVDEMASMTAYHNSEGLARLVVADNKNSIVHVSTNDERLTMLSRV